MEKNKETDYSNVSLSDSIFCIPVCSIVSILKTWIDFLAKCGGFLSAHRRNRICLDNQGFFINHACHTFVIADGKMD